MSLQHHLPHVHVSEWSAALCSSTRAQLMIWCFQCLGVVLLNAALRGLHLCKQCGFGSFIMYIWIHNNHPPSQICNKTVYISTVKKKKALRSPYGFLPKIKVLWFNIWKQRNYNRHNYYYCYYYYIVILLFYSTIIIYFFIDLFYFP